MDNSTDIGELATALAKAQNAIQNPVKNREVEVALRDNKGKYKFKYATFDGIIDALRPHLTANGLWFVQAINDGNMVTRITHASGQWIDSIIPMPSLTGKPQEIGSLITYFKRYGLSAAFGVAVDEDDDANAAEGNSVEFKSGSRKSDPLYPDAEDARPATKPLVGKHKTRDSLKQAAANIANALREAADGGDQLFIDEVLSEWAIDIEQIKTEGPKAWWSNKDWGLEAVIAEARATADRHLSEDK